MRELERHIGHVHRKLRPYKCNICRAHFGSSQSLKNHKLKRHQESKVIIPDTAEIIHETENLQETNGQPLAEENAPSQTTSSKTNDNPLIRPNDNEHTEEYLTTTVISNEYSMNLSLQGKRPSVRISPEKRKSIGPKKQSFNCDICGKNFSSKYHLFLHEQTVHNSDGNRGKEELKDLKCEICNKDFKKKKGLIDHIDRIHKHDISKVNQFDCNYCDKYYTTRGNLDRHVDAVHFGKSFICDICDKSYVESAQLKNHFKAIHDVTNAKYICKFCQKVFVTNTQLQNHIKYVHEKIRKLVCQTCGKVFGRNSDYRIHYNNVHLQKKSFKRDQCEKCFSQSCNLKTHQRDIHQNLKSFKCDTCEKSFHRNNALQIHMRVTHAEEKLKCQYCSMEFGSPMVLKYHINCTHFPQEPVRIKCHLCDLTFKNKSYFENTHLKKIHSGNRSKCEICEKELRGEQELKMHMAVIHDTTKTHKCDICEEYFVTMRDVRIHNYRYHEKTMEREFTCPYCDIRKPTQHSIRKHVESAHCDNYMCEICNKWYKTERNLNRDKKEAHYVKKS